MALQDSPLEVDMSDSNAEAMDLLETELIDWSEEQPHHRRKSEIVQQTAQRIILRLLGF